MDELIFVDWSQQISLLTFMDSVVILHPVTWKAHNKHDLTNLDNTEHDRSRGVTPFLSGKYLAPRNRRICAVSL